MIGVQTQPVFGQTEADLRQPLAVNPPELPPIYSLWAEMMESIHPGYVAPKTAAEAAARDSDGDGLSDLQEAYLFTDPLERPLTPGEVQAQLAEIERQAAVSALAEEAAMAAARALLAP